MPQTKNVALPTVLRPILMVVSPLKTRDYQALMQMALQEAERSVDPSTQNGAVLISTDDRVLKDHNQFPLGVQVSDERWQRPLKYRFVEHAERNVIYIAARQGVCTEQATIVCPWAACSDCARAIVQSGITSLVRLASSKSHWHEEVALGDTIMNEANVQIVELDPIDLTIPELRRNGQIWYP